jgi:hypothetical protein
MTENRQEPSNGGTAGSAVSGTGGTAGSGLPGASVVLRPMNAVRSAVRDIPGAVRGIPGAGTVRETAEGVMEKVGAVSPRTRRMTAYAGAGLLGVAGVVDWPVAAAGAAVVWLTQSRPGARTGAEPAKGMPLGTDETGATAATSVNDPSAKQKHSQKASSHSHHSGKGKA